MSRRLIQRSVIRLSAIAVGMLIVWMTVEPAWAQRGRGFRRLFGVSRAQLASLPDVQKELNMNDTQKTRVDEVNNQLRNDRHELLGTTFESWSTVQPRMDELNNQASEKVNAVLEPAQRKRLQEIAVQQNGPRSLQDPEVVAELSLSPDQKTKLTEVVAENTKTFEAAFGESNWDTWRERSGQLADEADQRLLGVLTPEQQTKLDSLKGEPFEVDMSQFFRRGRSQ
ncbi:MAG: hypothetical protein AB7G28_25550 [Pirellulales bacterium]